MINSFKIFVVSLLLINIISLNLNQKEPNTIKVINLSGTLIYAFVSNYSTISGSSDWFPIKTGDSETWVREKWDMVVISFPSDERIGFYVYAEFGVIFIVHSKDKIEKR